MECKKSGILELYDPHLVYKVPHVTISFWLVNIIATAVGETTAEFLNNTLNFGLTKTTIFMSIFLVIMIFIQFKSKKYVPQIYWLTMILMSVVGTLGSNHLRVKMGAPILTTVLFFIALIVSLTTYYMNTKTKIKREEAFYWVSILFMFVLGTVAGDVISEGLKIGYFNSMLMFALFIGIMTLSYYSFRLNSVITFGIIFIITRSFGVSVGNFLSQSDDSVGLGLRITATILISLLTIIFLTIYLTKTSTDMRSKQSQFGKIENDYEGKKYHWDYPHVFREELICTLVKGLDRTLTFQEIQKLVSISELDPETRGIILDLFTELVKKQKDGESF